ncbi:hypothetical protein MOUN0_L01002 [Monosporozyma unispora]|nr:hypothetical protein C6P44_003052 [Kazachstania unispora]
MNQADKIVENLGKKKNKTIVTNLLSSSQCHICHEILNIPIMLSCGHNYCYMCLKSWFKTNENRLLGCPDCRKSVDVTPAFNLFLDHQLKFILNLVKEKGVDSKWDQTLSEREQDEAIYKNDVAKDMLFANVFKNSTLSVVDMDDDGIPRCGNCHWELDPDDMDEEENVCPHCHYRIRNNVAPADSENVMSGSVRSIANDLRRRAEEYSEGEYDDIIDDIRRYSDSDLESGVDDYISHEDSANRNMSLHDNEAIDEDANSKSENEDELEEEHDSEMDSFIENDEEDNDEEIMDSEDEPSSMSRKRKYSVLDDDEENQINNDANSSEQDSDFYEHNEDEGFVSGDSLDDGSDNEVAQNDQEMDEAESENEEDVSSRKRSRRGQVVLSDDE